MDFIFLLVFMLSALLSSPAFSWRHTQSSLCQYVENEYSCKKPDKSTLEKINIPSNACILHHCKQCIKGLKTFILNEDELLEPESFLLQTTNRTSLSSSAYTCSHPNGTECGCDSTSLCTGSPEFCINRTCNTAASCSCSYIKTATDLIHINEDVILRNPTILTLEYCLFDKSHPPVRGLHRHLLEDEKAVFVQKNLNFTFEDPNIILPSTGKLIVRTDDFEGLFTVSDTKTVTLPLELLAYKTTLRITYLHPSGHIVNGEIHVDGKSFCMRRHCYFCRDFLNHLKCYPHYISYLIYSLLLICALFIIYCVKTILKSLIYLFQVLFYILYALFKMCKLLARCSLLLGSYIGHILHHFIISFYQFLENHGAPAARIPFHQLVLFTLILHIHSSLSDCNTQEIIQSDLRTCKTSSDNTQECHLFSTAEISLPAISSESCLIFTDKKDLHLFTVKIRLDEVSCSFHTKRLYFTFPVTPKHLSQISCIFNAFCGRGIHCHKERIGRSGLNFEGETAESRSFQGRSSCVGGSLGNGCFILTRAACNFYRTWYVPDLLHSYEVSEITGHSCKYHVSVTHIENNTLSRIVVTDSAYTDTGIKVTVLGAYDQPQVHLSDAFIQRVGRPSEAYLAPVCKRNFPIAGQIGAIQANQSYTKDFIFDPNLSVCDFFEDKLRCNTPRDPLIDLKKSLEYALPMERDLHLFKIQDGKLASSLLISSAIRLQLHFQNFKIAAKSNTVCPKFKDSPLEVAGCYQCPILARITFSALSTCQPGTVLVSFQEINVHTKALRLETETTSLLIKFMGDKKCYKEKLCLKAQTLIQCQQINFCLQEPSIELLSLNTNYTVQSSSITTNKWWEWVNLPSFGNSLFVLKFLGSSLFLICLIITTLSTVISCCCRGR